MNASLFHILNDHTLSRFILLSIDFHSIKRAVIGRTAFLNRCSLAKVNKLTTEIKQNSTIPAVKHKSPNILIQ